MESETVPKKKYMADTRAALAANGNLFKSVLKWAKKQKLDIVLLIPTETLNTCNTTDHTEAV